MSDRHAPESHGDIQLENFAAELTSAAYPLALRNGIGCSWIKMELGLWRALAETVKKWAREKPLAGSWDEFKAWRDGLAVDLTEGAFYIAVKNGIKGSLLEVELDLYRAFRLVIRRRYRAR